MQANTVDQDRKAFHPQQTRICNKSQLPSRTLSIAGFNLDGTNDNSDANCLFGTSHTVPIEENQSIRDNFLVTFSTESNGIQFELFERVVNGSKYATENALVKNMIGIGDWVDVSIWREQQSGLEFNKYDG
jgi:hypothetical protein